MAFSTEIPNQKGPLTLDAAEAAVGIGTQTRGTLAQVSGIAAGFNLFTPTANATYHLVIRGQDAATGAPTNAFVDVICITAIAGWAHAVVTSTTTAGTPGARTYSNNAGSLKIVVATGGTWYIDIALTRFPA